ncbi:MAG: hypothetical protein A2161_11690 [Candidatus Schekmanbacteria bacterium RBG_13_48_7]|uniref:Histidine kinase n=1 Tax=Candidatus Schekmanbacteria bacterium RBG_13_48_7 TaxID=1817878 RepID=A0A1F7S0P7_9BACT|nr:MAG: hypothetical protein A2161_11690 [Candidatus Schekmanbacteria bacterium RBG_13_48_7]
MSIITISRDSYSNGKEVAVKAAEILGYKCLNEEVFEAASKQYNVPGQKLIQVFHELPSFFGDSVKTLKNYIAYVQSAFTGFLVKDNLIYYGPAGHFLIQGVSHVLKVRIIANTDDRIKTRMNRENTTEKEAIKYITKDVRKEKKWAKLMFGVDGSDPSFYDLLINTSQIDISNAVQIIVDTVNSKKFQPMTYSKKCMENYDLSSRVRALLIEIDPEIRVRSESGDVYIYTKAHSRTIEKNTSIIKQKIEGLEGVKSVNIHVTEDVFQNMAGTMR